MRSCDNAALTRHPWRAALLLAGALQVAAGAQSPTVAEAYRSLLAREDAVRGALLAAAASAARGKAAAGARELVAAYEELARRNPTSGYSDNALWQGGVLAADLFNALGEAADERTARRLLHSIKARFPTSSLNAKVPAQLGKLEAPRRPAVTARSAAAAAGSSSTARRDAPPASASGSSATAKPAAATLPATLTHIRRELLPDAVRVTLALDRETPFFSEEIANPARVYVDLQNTRVLYAMKDADLTFVDGIVRQIRVGRQADDRTRVVVDLASAARASVYPIYNPYRLVIDIARTAAAVGAAVIADARAGSTTASVSSGLRGATSAATPGIAPAPPAANGRGGFSLSRQLGLSVARIVLDPGHGGHDPGARANGVTEAELTLDIALRLEKLLLQQPNVEVVLTRRTNEYVALEERTRIANREQADLFLSIHGNASTNTAAHGIETYFLNFAPDAAAEAIAARENAGSSKTMRELTGIVKAITFNDKLDESREFAGIVQSRLYSSVRTANRQARNLGVKQAPFQVLIGASMPSILAEISFLTNRQEGNLLKTDKYRAQIAEGLLAGVMEYQRTLKKDAVVARAAQ
jgi:N-acetylmuramoyl-L-alanine amidase